MNIKKILIVFTVLVMLVGVLVGCQSDNGEFRQVYYSSEQEKFVETGNKLTIYEDFRYEEVFKMTTGDKLITGNYIRDKALDLLYVEANDASFDKFKREYRKDLKAAGFTNSEIDNIIMPGMTGKGEIYRYKDYYYKVGNISAAREGTPESVSQLDGVYNFTGILSGKLDRMMLKLGIIYQPTIDEFGEEHFTEKIGEYSVNGDFITIKPTVALQGGNVNKPMRYLLADIVLPVKYQENADEDNKYEGNDVITIYDNVKIKVIVSTFYTDKAV